MKTVIKMMILLVTLSGLTMARLSEAEWRMFYEKFPLIGKTWLFGKGSNNRIYPSFSNAAPTHLIMVTFPGDLSGDFVIRWANLMGLSFKSTAHLLNEVNYQFNLPENRMVLPWEVWVKTMVTDRDTVISLAKRKIPDTLWSCDEFFSKNTPRKRNGIYADWRVRYIDGDKKDEGFKFASWTDRNADNSPWKGQKMWYHKDKPVCVEAFPFRGDSLKGVYIYQGAPQVFDKLPRYYKTMNISAFDNAFIDYCDNQMCYEYEPEAPNSYQPKLEFYQIHLYPVTKWYPRKQPYAGTPLMTDDDKWVMSMREAKMRREESIRRKDYTDSGAICYPFLLKDPTDSTEVPWSFYRNPYYSDSASTVISVQFVYNDNILNPEYLDTRIVDTSESNFDGFFIDRIPNRIVKVSNQTSYSREDVELAVLRLYAKSAAEDSRIVSAYRRCSNWKEKDIEIGEKYRFPHIPNDYWVKKKRFGGSFIADKRQDIIKGGITAKLTSIDTNYIETRYIYDGCPCLPIKELNNYTASDLQSFIYRTPPLCDATSMSNALYVLWAAYIGKHITNVNDVLLLKRRAVQIGSVLTERVKFNNELLREFPQSGLKKIKDAMATCPKSWEISFRDSVDNQPLYYDYYHPQLKSFVESILPEVKIAVKEDSAKKAEVLNRRLQLK